MKRRDIIEREFLIRLRNYINMKKKKKSIIDYVKELKELLSLVVTADKAVKVVKRVLPFVRKLVGWIMVSVPEEGVGMVLGFVS